MIDQRSMNFIPTELPGVTIIEPRVLEDARGFFMETFQNDRFREAGLPTAFVQDCHSRSAAGTLRGLHYQIEHPQGKLVRCIAGEVFDVAVDLRLDSPTLGRWIAVELSDRNRRQVYLPPGVAHGFCTVSQAAEVVYKCTDRYYPQYERTIAWNDPELAIAWPVTNPLLSEKDRRGLSFAAADKFSSGSI
ncbi:MAG TPA: dTDP-4-dehydrorhamnose 3,5-epimerase [Pirellulales bacterium]|nr:dTDP-4-dehydrorhamnose 3,5-epimerase [Pirellulales bacterium]